MGGDRVKDLIYMFCLDPLVREYCHELRPSWVRFACVDTAGARCRNDVLEYEIMWGVRAGQCAAVEAVRENYRPRKELPGDGG